ncbi:MAG: hypothetical protein DI534_08625 [Leifsonia xyli]|nr:MAG: hypothetical protein DI534_08625 [Leifsonia xyli]
MNARIRSAVAALAATVVIASALSVGAGAYAADPGPTGKPQAPVTVTVPGAQPITSPAPSPSPSATRRPGGGTPSTPAIPSEPSIPQRPATDGAKATVDGDYFTPGSSVEVRAEGFDVGEQVQIVLYSDPQLVGNVTAGADGVLSHRFTLPDDLELGTHTLQLTGWASKRVALADVLVVASPAVSETQRNAAFGLVNQLWWIVGGVLLLALLCVGSWWIVRAMRAPAAGQARA